MHRAPITPARKTLPAGRVGEKGGKEIAGKPRIAKEMNSGDRLLTVDEVAERLGTGVRFIRRLIQERRIRYVKLGKHVRIAESVLAAYIDASTVPTLREARSRFGKAA